MKQRPSRSTNYYEAPLASDNVEFLEERRSALRRRAAFRRFGAGLAGRVGKGADVRVLAVAPSFPHPNHPFVGVFTARIVTTLHALGHDVEAR